MSHVFGPVPSRRLGFSLGVDPLVPKTCTMDCVYCELGRTTDRTVSRSRFVDIDSVLRELEERLRECPHLDFITVSGSGEPTLSLDLGELVEGIARLSDSPIAVLTNGSLLGDPSVRAGLSGAAVVAPSLDAVSPRAFEVVNRPHPSLDPADSIRSMAEFRRDFAGEVWMESLFVAGLNDDEEEVALISRALEQIGPDRVHVNTIARPPADVGALRVEETRLRDIARRLGPRAEVIAAPARGIQPQARGDIDELIVAMAERRPVTAGDVASAIGTNLVDASKRLSDLVEDGRLELVRHGETLYYRA